MIADAGRASPATLRLLVPQAKFCALVITMTTLAIPAAYAGPAHDAARQGDLAALTKLLASGTPVEDRDSTGETPLLSASLAGHAKIVDFLLSQHAKLDARNDRGLTPLDAATYGGHADVAELLIKNGAAVNDANNRYKTTPLIIAAEDGRTELVKLLISNGADLEAAEVNGYSALTQAWAVEKWDTVDVLLAAGANCQPKEIMGSEWFEACTKRKK